MSYIAFGENKCSEYENILKLPINRLTGKAAVF